MTRTKTLVICFLVLLLSASALLACASAAQPDTGTERFPVAQGGEPTTEPTAESTTEPTPKPTVCVTFLNEQDQRAEDCFTPPDPEPETNPEGDLGTAIKEAREANQARRSPKSPENTEPIYIEIWLEDGNNGKAVIKWLKGKNLEYKDRISEKQKIFVYVPVLLLPDLSEVDGVNEIWPVEQSSPAI